MTELARPQKFCHACGESIDREAEICPKCGVRQMGYGFTPASGKSKVVAGLLAFFVGILGIHKFYVGRVGQGIIMLVLSITIIGMFITGIWAFIDTIRYLVMPDDEFENKVVLSNKDK